VSYAASNVIERKYNRVRTKPPYQVPAATAELQQKLFVADLHSDSLLWGRNLLKRSTTGHVDIPRLQQAHVTLQAFTVNNVFVRDLENFKSKLSQDSEIRLPQAVHQVVSEPNSSNPDVSFPEFRGLSDSKGNPETGKKAAALYFPKPFNDEQVRILQLLEISDGVVVQGPPGTGKTHTIANVISHYLANGKRVLVTSMKEPALGVLREALPSDIQPLAISLLTSEHEGMKHAAALAESAEDMLQSRGVIVLTFGSAEFRQSPRHRQLWSGIRNDGRARTAPAPTPQSPHLPELFYEARTCLPETARLRP
jgi:hypothetical protein